MSRTTSLFVVADIHGSEVCFRKFLNAARFYEVDTLILAGDVTGKALVPIVLRGDGRAEARVAGRVQTARGEDGIRELEARIRFNGFYPYRCDEATYRRLSEDPEHRDRVFTEAMADGLRGWVRLADERLRGSKVRCLVMPGNDDGDYVDGVLAESESIVNQDGQIVDFGEVQLLGFGPSNVTPWHTHREIEEPEIAARLDELQRRVDPGKPLIVNTHVPPWGSGLDVAPKLREDLSIVIEGGEPVMVPVGSTAVRDFLQRTQPFLSLHGHIHESRGAARIGRTLAINPGSHYSTGALYGAIVTIRNGKVQSHQLVAG